MKVTLEHVRKIAALARLEFTPAEEASLAHDLTRILDYVEQLEKLDVSGVEPMSHVLDLHNVLRADEAAQRITRDEALSSAPEADARYFRVPKVID
jgi:aspartyl-tRNA(Asn)/glutamyl-tRNA(Gln) amidotransferase subunit C